MIKIAFDLDDDNVRYMISEGGATLCGTVPMNDQFKAIYQLCKDMYETERRIRQTLSNDRQKAQ